MVLNITKLPSWLPPFTFGPEKLFLGHNLEQLRIETEIGAQYPEFSALKTSAEKRDWINKKHRVWSKEIAEIEKKRDVAQYRLAKLKVASAACDAVIKWMEAGLQMGRPDHLAFPSLRKAMAAGDYVTFPGAHETPEFALSFEKEVFRNAELFVVEHDWAQAFEASELSNAPFRLPYDVCAFEFKVSGYSLVAVATQFETDVLFSPCIKADDTWVICAGSYSATRVRNTRSDICDVIAPQIRAICIALEAKVARADVTRAPYSGSWGKNSGAISRPYHVVSLAHRSARPLPTGNVGDRKVRLHFRRGHWRHFDKHQTWINWMLVGDPDLGFVDKHYRL